ncbi:hypothetical protein V6R21_19500 [Limibacter armeniacum]|uniref:hypothetical protein n=1 Tax=Limibacter armeniacum TaxID=466084 RepID=UPI002FE57D06
MKARLVFPYAICLFLTVSLYQCSKLRDKEESMQPKEQMKEAAVTKTMNTSYQLNDSLSAKGDVQ